MRVVTWKCDGCGVKLSDEEASRERCFTLRTPFSQGGCAGTPGSANAMRPVADLPTVGQEGYMRSGHTYVWTPRGFRCATGLFGLWWRTKQRLVNLTRWWRPRLVCAEVDRAAGCIGMAEERWSWRRWRWERAL
jgi:hypothetical protein